MGIPDHLICLLRNLYAGQEATVRTGHGTTDFYYLFLALLHSIQDLTSKPVPSLEEVWNPNPLDCQGIPLHYFHSIIQSLFSLFPSSLSQGVHQGWYCHPVYLTSMKSTSWETLGWMKHKLESRLLGEISITSDMQMTPSLWQKVKNN